MTGSALVASVTTTHSLDALYDAVLDGRTIDVTRSTMSRPTLLLYLRDDGRRRFADAIDGPMWLEIRNVERLAVEDPNEIDLYELEDIRWSPTSSWEVIGSDEFRLVADVSALSCRVIRAT